MTNSQIIEALKATRELIRNASDYTLYSGQCNMETAMENLDTLITQLEQAEQGVDIEAGARAMLDLEIPDGFDRNGSHSSGTYQEYKWSLRQYLRSQDEWKAEQLARACAEAWGMKGRE